MTENWQKENFIKAFLFHKNDIACLAQHRDVVCVRFYIGIIKNEDGSDEPDMIVVGVNSDNEDIIYDDISKRIENPINWRANAVKRISHQSERNLKEFPVKMN